VFDSNEDEWQVTPVYLGTPTTFGHSIEVVDFFTINGVKFLLARDSAGQFSSPKGYRLISQDFLTHRCRGAMYFLGIAPITSTPSPTPSPTPSIAPFLTDMSFGQTSTEIARLQAFLTKLGFFPTWQSPTVYYGSLTQTAVFNFQKRYVANQGLWAYIVVMGSRGRYCSTMTRTALNLLISSV
jgi:hypothetical protein